MKSPQINGLPCSDEINIKHIPAEKQGLPEQNLSAVLPNGEYEPQYGKRLIVHTVDDLATYQPDRIWATVAIGQNVDDGFRNFTTKQLANAVNNVAHWIDRNMGCSNNFEVLAYLGASDVRYAILFFAAVKCGYVFMVPSVRNAEAGQLHVLSEAKCNKLLHSAQFASNAKQLQTKRTELKTFELASLDELIDMPAKHYPYNKTWEESWKDPVIIAHSSGSTGFPKAITITNGVFSVYDSMRFIPKVEGRRNQDNSLYNLSGGGRFYNPYPPFHLAGLFAMTYVPLFYTSTVLMGPADKPPTGQMLSDVMRAIKVRAAWCPPTVLEQLLEIPGGFEQAAELDFIMYTGGPLAPAAGNMLSQVTDLCQLYGSTESGTQVTLIPTRETWEYFEWHPYLANEMEPVGDGTYEMVIHRNPNLLWFRQIYHTFPDLETYRTNDLFVKHPTNPNLWKFHGRRDDVIVLSNGEKFNPVIMEGIIAGDPLLHGALIVGMARSQAALLVEPRPDHGLSDEELIDRIWPTVQKANTEGPGHGRIFPSKIMVASPEKPFIRAGKGTVIRGRNIIQYEREIAAIYYGTSARARKVPQLSVPCDIQDIRTFVRDSVSRLLAGVKDLADGTDFFSLGLDSLQTTEFASQMKAWIKTNPEAVSRVNITTKTIYENPSVQDLVSYLDRCLNQRSDPVANGVHGETERLARMEAMMSKYTADLLPKRQVILTGSTGSLGTHLLKLLLVDPGISHVYCLNRSADARQRHLSMFDKQGIAHLLSTAASKAVFLRADFGHPQFGLSDVDYSNLLSNADVILHNAWAVNFNQQLPSFEATHVRGVRNFVDFCIASRRRPHLLFVSSVSAVQNWCRQYGAETPVPESVVHDYSVAMEMGYGESKHVSERILNAAAAAGVNASVLRVGQIGGPLSPNAGEWNKSEWFPTLLKSSKALGCIPDTLGAIDWIPVDTLATIIVDIIHDLSRNGCPRTFNLVNPRKAEWRKLLPVVLEHWEVSPVSFAAWLDALKAIDGTGKEDLTSVPALKVLDFFVDMAADLANSSNRSMEFVTEHGQRSSKAMTDLRPIDQEAMNTWLDQWNF